MQLMFFFVSFVTIPGCPQVCFRVPFLACAGSPFRLYIPRDLMPHILSLKNAGCVPKADDLQIHLSLSDVDGDEESCSNQ